MFMHSYHVGLNIGLCFHCRWPWPAAYINFMQITHQIQILTNLLCPIWGIFICCWTNVGNQITWTCSQMFLFLGLLIARSKLERICRFTYSSKQTARICKERKSHLITKTGAKAHSRIQPVFSWCPLGGSWVSSQLQQKALARTISYLQMDVRGVVAQDWGSKGC